MSPVRSIRSREPTPSRAQDEKIARAATKLFSAYGFRKTSMEQIAAAASVAKPTLYAYFASKEAVFAAVCGVVTRDLQAAAEAAAAREAEPRRALRAALIAKFTAYFEIVHASHHAAELLASSDEVSARTVADAHSKFIRFVGKLLEAMGTAKGEAREVAELLDACAEGVASKSASSREVARRIALLVERMFAGA